MTWFLRRATEDDLDGIMAIENAEFGTDAWSTESMRAELASEHTHYLVVVPTDGDERIIGYAGLLVPAGADDADIQTIAVSVDARRNGLGRTLMLALIAEARARGAATVFLEVRADNPGAKALYDSLGFESIAVRPKYYQPDGVDAIIMRLEIPVPETSLA